MMGLTASYGFDSQAGGDPRVAELLKRSTTGHYEALKAFENTLSATIAKGQHPWTTPASDLTAMGRIWITLALWERATVILDAFVNTGSLPDAAYRQIDDACDLANAASIKVIAMKAELEQGKKPGMVKQPESLPTQSAGESNCDAVWAAYEAIYRRVRSDFYRIEQLGIPASMQKVHTLLKASFEPKEKVFTFVQRQWYASTTTENKVQILRDVLPTIQHIYSVGQQIWTPYLLGQPYIEIVRTATRSTAIFSSLNLGFDPWIITDPDIAGQKVSNTESCQELVKFWQSVADPSAAKALQDEITTAVHMGTAALVKGKSFKIAPWMPQYAASSEITIGGHTFQSGDIFTVYPKGGQGGKRTLDVRSTGRLSP